ncbi:hypothetical protein MPSEU_000539900 [Mayamaea pseudoterrestris]|nr:hypothetical protein MPSEU_000539900 [Mayamaea pseudoterrestris]
MAKPFDYSKWDKIELSDDEDDVHPNIDRESWFRLKHRSRVEREENEEKDKKNILAQIEQADQRMKILRHDIQKIKQQQAADLDDDDDLDEIEALQAELDELEASNAKRYEKLEEYEKNKKWNVDNLGTVVSDKTEVSKTAGKKNYTESGFIPPKDEDTLEPTVLGKSDETEVDAAVDNEGASKTTSSKTIINPATGPVEKFNKADIGVMETYPQFCEKYADVVEDFMKIPDLNGSRDFLLQHAEVLLQENASNYLLLASLEDEMNGRREAMQRTARQSQIITNIAELAKTLDTHPGNVILPFFKRMEQREHLEEFIKGVKSFQDKIVQRAVVKRREIDAERAVEATSKNLEEVPKEERLGPGGLDPLEVIDTLPEDMVKAFESRDVEQLKAALMKLEPEEADYHMKRCVDSGLWNAGGD